MAGKAIDYKGLAPKYEGLLRRIDKAQWEIGQSLYEDGIISDGQRQRLAEVIGCKPKALKTYWEVYTNFQERFPDGRPENIGHGVLEELNRLSDEDEQNMFLARYPRPTASQAKQFVNEKLFERTGRMPVRRSEDTTSLRVGGVVFRISVTENGRGTMTVEGASNVGTVRKSEMEAGTWMLEFSK